MLFLCYKEFDENEETTRKHADHCHITREYRGAACQYCNMNNLSLKGTEIPILFHNLKGYEMHHIIKKLEESEVEVIGTSKENLITVKVHLLKGDDGGEEIDGNIPFDTSNKIIE